MKGIDRFKISLIFLSLTGACILAISSWAAGGRMAAHSAASLFAENCAMCHGEDGKGKPNWRAHGQPDFTDPNFQKSRSDQEIGDVIRDGKGRFMPSFKSKLSLDQINELVHQVRAFGKK